MKAKLTAYEKLLFGMLRDRVAKGESINLTNDELAEIAGCSYPTISRSLRHLDEQHYLKISYSAQGRSIELGKKRV